MVEKNTTMNEKAPLEPELLMAGYVLGDLSLEEARAFEQLLAETPEAAAELADLQSALDLSFGAIATPSPHLKESVLASDRPLRTLPNAVGAKATVTYSPPQPTSTNRWASIGLGTVAAGVILALGIQNYTLRRTVQTLQADIAEQSLDEAAILTYYLAPTDNTQASGELTGLEVVINPAQSQLVLKTDALPPLDDGQIYALWTVVAADAPITKDEKNAVLTATFTADEVNNQIQPIALLAAFQESGLADEETSAEGDRASIKAIAVTIEDAATPQQHQSSPILIQRL